jgi:predicted DNA binding CopG/RHH family protein
VGRPRTGHAKDLIAIRISPRLLQHRLLQQLRRLAAKQSKPYQTMIHEMLEEAVRKQVA